MTHRVFVVGPDQSVARILTNAGYKVVPLPTGTTSVTVRQWGSPMEVQRASEGDLCPHEPEQFSPCKTREFDDSTPTIVFPLYRDEAATNFPPAGSPASDAGDEEADQSALLGRYGSLTVREREVAGLVVQGFMNKEISAELDIAERTVKVHRARAMAKLQARSLPDLVRILDHIGEVVQNCKPCHSAGPGVVALHRLNHA